MVIDDRLPTRNGNLVYLRGGKDNEFWSPLLEKAYAKLYGSYSALEGGLSIEAAVDFSGGIPEMVNLRERQKEKDENGIFNQLLKAYESKAFMTCSLKSATSVSSKCSVNKNSDKKDHTIKH